LPVALPALANGARSAPLVGGARALVNGGHRGRAGLAGAGSRETPCRGRLGDRVAFSVYAAEDSTRLREGSKAWRERVRMEHEPARAEMWGHKRRLTRPGQTAIGELLALRLGGPNDAQA
jgi:hypothetical protein